jgi:rfaE bifunctional protein nucleotidyltransferase chain/domain
MREDLQFESRKGKQVITSKVNLDENSTKLLSIASRVYRDSVFLSNLKPEERIIDNLKDLEVICDFLRIFGVKLSLTMGTFDLLHIGHARYVGKARENGSLLIVGVEDDEKARGRKGENRPVVPYTERSELLTYLRHADLVVKKSMSDGKWEMIKVVKPDVLVAVEGTYTREQVKELEEFCKEIVVLPRQAETSTSAKIRKMVLDGADTLTKTLSLKLPQFVLSIYQEMRDGGVR